MKSRWKPYKTSANEHEGEKNRQRKKVDRKTLFKQNKKKRAVYECVYFPSFLLFALQFNLECH